eukprot:SAG31_NODE_953_length_10799_cov_4.245657_10_plen_110_part_00
MRSFDADVLFWWIKFPLCSFDVAVDRPYGELAGLTCCAFYYRDRLVELEPIGPLETLRPGEMASFSETWSILPSPVEAVGDVGDLSSAGLAAIEKAVEGLDPVPDSSKM